MMNSLHPRHLMADQVLERIARQSRIRPSRCRSEALGLAAAGFGFMHI